MITVRLCAKGGEIVTDVQIPAFGELPRVIIWGVRTFVYDHDQYREAFAYMVPTIVEGP